MKSGVVGKLSVAVDDRAWFVRYTEQRQAFVRAVMNLSLHMSKGISWPVMYFSRETLYYGYVVQLETNLRVWIGVATTHTDKTNKICNNDNWVGWMKLEPEGVSCNLLYFIQSLYNLWHRFSRAVFRRDGLSRSTPSHEEHRCQSTGTWWPGLPVKVCRPRTHCYT